MSEMSALQKAVLYLYQIRDPQESAGFDFDGYTGVTNDFQRRKEEHFRDLAAGKHSNPRLQGLYDKSGGNLEMRFVTSGSAEEILLRERATVNFSNKHANQQVGGGPLRVMSDAEVLQGFADLGAKAAKEAMQSQSKPKDKKRGHPTTAIVVIVVVVAVAAATYFGWKYWKTRKARIQAHDEALAAYEANVAEGWHPNMAEINQKLRPKHQITTQEGNQAWARGHGAIGEDQSHAKRPKRLKHIGIELQSKNLAFLQYLMRQKRLNRDLPYVVAAQAVRRQGRH